MLHKGKMISVRVDDTELALLNACVQKPSPKNGWRRVTKSQVIRLAIANYLWAAQTGALEKMEKFFECDGCEGLFLVGNGLPVMKRDKNSHVHIFCDTCGEMPLQDD